MNQDEESIFETALMNRKIPAKGSLGLLAHGDIGLKYWRLSRQLNKTDKA